MRRSEQRGAGSPPECGGLQRVWGELQLTPALSCPCRDSSDEETPRQGLGAVQARQGQERGRQLLQRIKDMIKGWRLPFRTTTRLQDQLEEEEEREGMLSR